MPDPISPNKVVNTLVDPNPQPPAPVRPAAGNARGIDLSTFLTPPQVDGELGRIAHYRVLDVLGHGGMGAVLLAEDTRLERRVALKIILPQYAGDADARQRFLREAKAAAKVNHDNVVTIFQVDEERGIPFIAMELLKGTSLEGYLEKKGEMSVGQIIRVAREIVEGLKAAHAAGLVHRDIKPANIWLESPKGRVKILDFGLAREDRADRNITGRAIVGTPFYMSPEQANGQKVDARSDLFSLGIVLYRLCTGKMPFTGSTMVAVLMSVCRDTPVPVRQLSPHVPPDLQRLIERLLAKQPGQRIQSAREVAADLAAVKKAALSGATPEIQQVVDVPDLVVDVPDLVVDVPDLIVVKEQTQRVSTARLVPTKSSASERTKRMQKSRTPRQSQGRLLWWLTMSLAGLVLASYFVKGTVVAIVVLVLALIFIVFVLTSSSASASSKQVQNSQSPRQSKGRLAWWLSAMLGTLVLASYFYIGVLAATVALMLAFVFIVFVLTSDG